VSTVRHHTLQPLPRRWQGPGFETFGSIFGFVYTFLAVNFLLAAANAPLLLGLALVADPVAAWPFFLVLSVTVAPSVAAAFFAFQSLKEADGAAVRPVAAFLRGYRESFRRVAPAGMAAVAAIGLLGVDLAIVQVMPAAAVLVPLIALALTAVVCVSVTVLAGVVLLPHARTLAILKASLYLAVQRWYLSLAALVLLGIVAAAVLVQPVIGVALVPAPLLFVVWSNASFAFQAALQDS
jgi:uncharacterized membrane protein YesL